MADADTSALDIIEGETREAMARLAQLPRTWEHRELRRDLLTKINTQLDVWLEVKADAETPA